MHSCRAIASTGSDSDCEAYCAGRSSSRWTGTWAKAAPTNINMLAEATSSPSTPVARVPAMGFLRSRDDNIDAARLKRLHPCSVSKPAIGHPIQRSSLGLQRQHILDIDQVSLPRCHPKLALPRDGICPGLPGANVGRPRAFDEGQYGGYFAVGQAVCEGWHIGFVASGISLWSVLGNPEQHFV
jgi:hypothetical protein